MPIFIQNWYNFPYSSNFGYEMDSKVKAYLSGWCTSIRRHYSFIGFDHVIGHFLGSLSMSV